MITAEAFARKLTLFVLRHWRRMLYWAVLIVVVVWLAPRQHDPYLSRDVWAFKVGSFQRSMLLIGGLLVVTFLILALVYTKPLSRALSGWFWTSFSTVCLLFIFHQVLLSAALFMNRTYVRETETRRYVAESLGNERVGDLHFIALDGSQPLHGDEIVNRLNQRNVKVHDTVHVTYAIGLFGIPFYPDIDK